MASGGRGRDSGAGVGRGQRQVSAGDAGLRSGGRRGAETRARRSGGGGQRKGRWSAGRAGARAEAGAAASSRCLGWWENGPAPGGGVRVGQVGWGQTQTGQAGTSLGTWCSLGSGTRTAARVCGVSPWGDGSDRGPRQGGDR